MTGASRRTGKGQSIGELAMIVGLDATTSKGGTVPRGFLAKVHATLLGREPAERASKMDIAREVVAAAGLDWQSDFASEVGSTITGEGIAALVRAAQEISQTPMRNAMSELDVSGIASAIVELSQPGDTPLGFDAITIAPLDEDDIDFSSNQWLDRLTEVQVWLGLDEPLPSGAEPSRTLRALFGQITDEESDVCFSKTDDGLCALTEIGAQHLETWLSRAVSYRGAFEEALEADESTRSATNDWKRLWEEGALSAERPIAIQADVRTWPIPDFTGMVEDEALELNPSFQRDSVWSLSDSRKLIDSVLRGIPLPSVILSKRLDGREQYEIVDGKQRLTAILRFVGWHPDGRKRADTMGDLALFEEDFRAFAKKHKLRAKDLEANFFPFPLPKYGKDDPLHQLSGKYYHEIRNEEVGPNDTKVISIFERTNVYKIPVIVYEKASLAAIHQVFERYNRQGKQLNAEELRNAAYHDLALTRALLGVSGDRLPVEEVAPFLPNAVAGRADAVAARLSSLGFGEKRFKRTKVLSWALAVLAHPLSEKDGELKVRSTSKQIDSLLESIAESKDSHPLYQADAVGKACQDLQEAVLLLTDPDLVGFWAPEYRRKRGKTTTSSKWEELPTVAALIVCLVLQFSGRNDLLELNADALFEFTSGRPSPEKSQSRTQWFHVADVVLGALEALKFDVAEGSAVLRQRLGFDGLMQLSRILEQGVEP